MIKLFGTLTVCALLIFVMSHTWPFSITAKTAIVQDQQEQEPENLKHCERPNENNPDVGNTDPNKIGCKCIRQCIDKKPEEGPQIKCKQPHCKTNQCDCPNPCQA